MMYLKICPVLISPIVNNHLTSYDPWNPNDTFCFEGIQGSMELTLKSFTKATHSYIGNAGLGRSTPKDRDACLSSLGRTERKQALKMPIFQTPSSKSWWLWADPKL